MMKRVVIDAPDAPQPAGGYAQAIEVAGATRTLYVSGQIPVAVDGSVPDRFEDQARLAWRNVIAQLRAAGMTLDNLVKVTIFLSDRKYIDDYRPSLPTLVQSVSGEPWLSGEPRHTDR